MKIIKKDTYRHIILNYDEIRKLYNIENKDDLTISTTLGSDNPFYIYHFNRGITYWEIEYTRKEIESKLNLLPHEKLIDFDFKAWVSYAFRIKTTKSNLDLLRTLDNKRLRKMNFLKRIFSFKFEIEYLYFNQWERLRHK